MNRRRAWKIGKISYILIYLVAMVLPRKIPFTHVSFVRSDYCREIFTQVLYYSGPFETVFNFLVLVPGFFITLELLGRSYVNVAMFFCIFLAGLAEIVQRVIPGRISSFQDFALNVSGVVAAYFVHSWFTCQ